MRAMLIFSIVALTVAGLLAAMWASRSNVLVGSAGPRASQTVAPPRAPSEAESSSPAHAVKPDSHGVHGTATHPNESNAVDAGTRLARSYLLLLEALGQQAARGAR